MKGRIALVVAVVLAGAALYVPLPLFVISPGSAVAVEDRLTLAGQSGEVSGDLLLLTVSLTRPSAFDALAAWLDDARDVIPRDEIVPEGVDEVEFLEAQRQLFRESGQVAAAVGLRAAGLDVGVTGRGARVAGVVPGGPSSAKLREGDVITAVDDVAVALASDLTPALAGRSAGDDVRLTVRRGSASLDVVVALGQVRGLDRPALGVAVETVGLDVRLPFAVDIDQGRIGGPSAGLMIALAVFDKADAGDLAAGRTIAGTGTIDIAGRVGPVGGVAQKVQAAKAAGATLLLAPAGEADAARRSAGGDLEVMEVATIDEAIRKLSSR
ncbi:MAG: PDZ domain-containing protein [Acidimicrobiales bacterium]